MSFVLAFRNVTTSVVVFAVPPTIQSKQHSRGHLSNGNISRQNRIRQHSGHFNIGNGSRKYRITIHSGNYSNGNISSL
jgi:hypothetical protein